MHLEIDRLTKHFGGVAALDDVSLEFQAGQVTAVIGPNGAGKTTLFQIIAGFQTPDQGSVRLLTEAAAATSAIELVGRRPYDIARHGVGVLFQDIRIFKRLSALENVAVGARGQLGENPLAALFSPSVVARQVQEGRAAARALLEFVSLAEKSHLRAGDLSYGQQKLVALARLLASDAQVLLLDEPTAGIHPDGIATLLRLIKSLASEQGKAVIMVEHNLNVVRRAGDWVYLMAGGRLEVFGKPVEVLRDDSLTTLFPTL